MKGKKIVCAVLLAVGIAGVAKCVAAEMPTSETVFLPCMGCYAEDCVNESHFHYCSADCTEPTHYHGCIEGCLNSGYCHGVYRPWCVNNAIYGDFIPSMGCYDMDCTDKTHFHTCSADCTESAHCHWCYRATENSVCPWGNTVNGCYGCGKGYYGNGHHSNAVQGNTANRANRGKHCGNGRRCR